MQMQYFTICLQKNSPKMSKFHENLILYFLIQIKLCVHFSTIKEDI